MLEDFSFPSNVDSTMLSTFDSCPRKFMQEFLIKRVPVGRSIHLHAGGCIASAMEDIRIMFYRDGLDLNTCFERAFANFVRNWGDMETPEKEYKDFVNCWGVVEAYFKEYPPATDYFQPLIKEDGSPAVEFRFAIPMNLKHPDTGDPILYSGRLDLLAEPRDDRGNVYAVDEKTTKALGSSWQYQWDMRGQFHGYVLAARMYGYNCVGALVRGMAIQQTQYGFQEKPLFFSNEQLTRWWDNAHRKVQRAIRMYGEAKEALEAGMLEDFHMSFDMSFADACGSYGGCQFVDLCTHPQPELIYSTYERRVWNPMAKDPTAESEDRLSQMETQSLASMMGEE